ncbi:MAG: Yip1 family protein [Planctomycetota bacterium]
MKPRRTMRHILETNPTRYVILVSCVVGIARSMQRAVNSESHFGLVTMLATTTLVGSLYGIVSLYLSAWLVGPIARLLGGKATQVEMRSAMSWGSIIYCWMLPLSLTMLVLSDTRHSDHGKIGDTLVFLSVVAGILSVWNIIVLSNAVGEANQFSSWRGFFAISIAFIVAILFLFMLFCAIVVALSAVNEMRR